MRPRLNKFHLGVPCKGSAIFLLSAVVTVCLAQSSTATDPQTRAKEIAALAPATEREDLRKAEVKDLSVVMSGVEKILRANILLLLDIWQFHEKEIPSVSRMRYMHRNAPEQIAAALRPYGYYRSTVDSRLSDLGSKWQAVYRIKPGDRVPVKNASVKITGPGADDPEFAGLQNFADQAIRSGQILDQQLYENIKRSIQSTAAQRGFFDAEFLAQEIVVDLESYTADVTLHFNTGDRYRIGEITITEDRDWLSDELLAKYVELEELDPFDASEIQKVQSDLSNTSYYRTVAVRASVNDAVDKVIPVSVDLTHLNPRQYVYGAGYGTDTGARVRLGLTGRRVNKSGQHYQAQANFSEIGFGFGLTYTFPTGDPRSDKFGLSFSVENEDSDFREFRNIDVGGNYEYRDGKWIKTYALNYQREENILDQSISTLLIPSAQWVRTFPFELQDRINVFRGNWLRLNLRGSSNDAFSDTTFIQGQISAKHIKSWDNGNRIITRGSLGTTAVSDFASFPLSLRFYTGGDRTVRGYDLNEIAPLDENNELVGGKHLAEISIEFERLFRPNFSWAVFADYGDAFNDSPELREGIGFGVRWRSPIGPIRLDIARGFDEPTSGGLEFHLGIGPDL